ncbi:hypothetical protein QTO34_014616 [Cnephaeus nilssonii]|uniref:Cystatin domain-containing protein n=1 Tax=Cnephaeus nilssonii TaxID=3371016 RepID=A0AA40LU75_CNENI|nr:hypothetical protein QTO34_014616 [Eptesicus nilssonii]
MQQPRTSPPPRTGHTGALPSPPPSEFCRALARRLVTAADPSAATTTSDQPSTAHQVHRSFAEPAAQRIPRQPPRSSEKMAEGIGSEDQDIFYSVKYEMKEGDCPVQSGKTWQDCDYKEPEQAATGECMATIVKTWNKEFSVVTQTCHITPGS